MARTRPKNLPDFSAPPVTEVILGVQFATLPFRTFHAGMLAGEFKGHPNISEHPPLEPVFEVFGSTAPAMAPMTVAVRAIQMMVAPPVPRYWFQSADGSEIIQFQPDRITQNWVRKTDEASYPRYETLVDGFEEKVRRTARFFRDHDLGEIAPNQCEVTYINTITLPDGRDPRVKLAEVFRVWSNEFSVSQGQEIEDATVRYRYVLKSADGSAYGRLHVSIDPAIRNTDQTPYVQFTLTARGRPMAPTIESALAFLDDGRNAIVQAFASMTRREMHTLWGRKDAI